MTEQEIRKSWMTRARDKSMSLDTLPAFLKELAEHEHTYGTIVLAVAAAALAAATAMDRSSRGGLTGFQGNVVMWEFVSGWFQWKDDCVGHRMQDFDLLLYPQHRRDFTSIRRETFIRLQKRAEKDLARGDELHPNVRAHMESIVRGEVPFGLSIEEDA